MMTPSHEPPESSWPRLRTGDQVALVSPASFPDATAVEDLTRLLRSWGLRVKIGEHVLDQRGYLAGHDADRLSDLNAAFADPEIRAVITTRGGAGAYRILVGPHATATVRHLLTSTEPVTHHRHPQLMSAAAEVPGHARGHLLGGWLSALAGLAGAGLPDLTGAILLIEAERTIGPAAAPPRSARRRTTGTADPHQPIGGCRPRRPAARLEA